VIGDSPASDIAGGRRAGLKTILVAASKTPPVRVAEERPDFVVASIGDLLIGPEKPAPPGG
jgi:glycerol 3-phosphatase-2